MRIAEAKEVFLSSKAPQGKKKEEVAKRFK